MCSGKSRALIKAFKTAPLDFDVYTFGKGKIVSRGAYLNQIEAKNVNLLSEIIVNDRTPKKNLIIDECQFYEFWCIQDIDLQAREMPR